MPGLADRSRRWALLWASGRGASARHSHAGAWERAKRCSARRISFRGWRCLWALDAKRPHDTPTLEHGSEPDALPCRSMGASHTHCHTGAWERARRTATPGRGSEPTLPRWSMGASQTHCHTGARERARTPACDAPLAGKRNGGIVSEWVNETG